MVQVALRPLTFEEFLTWDDGTGQNFELIDGFPLLATPMQTMKI